ncbi:winged helix-turn-helix transcriptional regulator [Paenibacillus sp. UMB4589-SE434]
MVSLKVEYSLTQLGRMPVPIILLMRDWARKIEISFIRIA